MSAVTVTRPMMVTVATLRPVMISGSARGSSTRTNRRRGV